MPEVSITGWLDPALKYFAEQSGIPIDQYSSQVGGEGIGTALEVVADFFTKGWLNKAVQAAAGLIANGYAIWGKDVPMRLRRELLALGTHELLRIVDPKPSDVIEFRRSLDSFIRSATRGDWNAALSSVLRTPSEIQAMVGVPPTPTLTASSSVGKKKYSVSAEIPSPPPPFTAPMAEEIKPSVVRGRYRVTG